MTVKQKVVFIGLRRHKDQIIPQFEEHGCSVEYFAIELEDGVTEEYWVADQVLAINSWLSNVVEVGLVENASQNTIAVIDFGFAVTIGEHEIRKWSQLAPLRTAKMPLLALACATILSRPDLTWLLHVNKFLLEDRSITEVCLLYTSPSPRD